LQALRKALGLNAVMIRSSKSFAHAGGILSWPSRWATARLYSSSWLRRRSG